MRPIYQNSRIAGALLLLLSSPLALRGQDSDSAYGYFRVVEGGTSTLFAAETETGEEIEQHRPILVGDQISVAPSGRLEIILPTFDLLRLEGATALVFESLADSPDADDDETAIRLFEGDLQLVLFEEAQTPRRPTSVRTQDFSVYFHDAGTYRVGLDSSQRLLVVVREGYAEVVTDRGSTIVRSGDEALITGGSNPSTRIASADGLDSLERWGEELSREAENARYASAEDPEYGDGYDDTYADTYDSRLRYAAAPLDNYGDWVRVDGRRAWRPYPSDGWRPYYQGRWVSTPDGLSWVSYEPWGWVPYHYGGWDRVDGFGWVWFPGRRFSVAHVYWYWGGDYAAWFPSAYYDRYYGRRFGWGHDSSFRFAGWGGGSWDSYRDWVFCPTIYLGRQRQNRYVHTGRSVREYTGWRELPRGVITTNTRNLTPRTWRNPDRVEEVLRGELRRQDSGTAPRELPDLRAYVAREPGLSSEEVLRTLRGGTLDPKPKARRASNGSLAPNQATVSEREQRLGTVEQRRRIEARSEALERQSPRVQPTVPRTGRTEVLRPKVDRTEKSAPRAPSQGRIERQRPTVQTPEAKPPRTREPVTRRPVTTKPVTTKPVTREPVTGPERRSAPTRPTVQRPEPPKTETPTRRSGTLERKATSVRGRPASPAPKQPTPKQPTASTRSTDRPSSGSVSRSSSERPSSARSSSARSSSAKSSSARPSSASSASARSSSARSSSDKPARTRASSSKESTAKAKPQQRRPAPKKKPARKRD